MTTPPRNPPAASPAGQRIPSDDARSGRRTVVRRTAEVAAPPAPVIPPEPSVEAAPSPAVRAAAARIPAPPPPAAEPHARMDGEALMAELAGLSAEEFAKMIGAGTPTRHQAGDAVEGRVVRHGRDAVFIDVGGKSEGAMDRAEFADGLPPLGSKVTAFVLSTDERGLRLARRLSGKASMDAVEQAHEAGVPVEGTVDSRNTGGFVVKIGSVRAFCPISQMDRVPLSTEAADALVGQKFNFLVTDVRGRDVVVSRRAVQEEALAEVNAARWLTLEEGELLDGTVMNVREFGMFVDIGGIQGLVPKRELGWDRDAAAARPGDAVRVRIMSVDREAKKLTFSMRDPAASPWARVGVEFVEGGVYPTVVTRLVDFGVFVRLAPGLEGLVPMRYLSEKKVAHPSEVVAAGEAKDARIVTIDSARERLELSFRLEGALPAPRTENREARPQMPKDTGRLGTFGDLFGGLKIKR